MTRFERRTPFWYLRRTARTMRDEIDEEIRLHLELRVEELRAKGLSLDEARREALRRFGDLEGTRRYCSRQGERKEGDVHRRLMLQELVQDARISLRGLLRAPMLTLAILITVGLGMGATTAIFTAIDAALLRRLPYANPDRLVWIYTDAPPFTFRFSVADYLALEAQQTHFEKIAGFTDRTMAFSVGTSAELLRGREVSWTYFGLLGITPALGRDFNDRDGRPGSPPAVIVSHGFWAQRLGARTDVVGRTIRLEGSEYALVGVLPATSGPLEQRQQFFVAAQFATPERRGPFPYWMLGRLRPGASREAASSELHAINRRIFPIWQASYQDERATWSLMDLEERLVGGFRATAILTLASVALVWLIACANASNLLIARVTSRRQELAVRAALGASRRRVVRHLLVESGLLAAGAAAIGAALAWTGIELLRSVGGSYFPRTQEIAVNGSAVVVLLTLTVMSGAIFGLIPALYGTRARVDDVLRSLDRSSTGSPAVQRLRRTLVGTQFAISTPLLVVAALLLVSLNELRQVDLGFDGRNLVTGSIRLPAALYKEPGTVESYWHELEHRLKVLPGVSGVAFTDSLPPSTAFNINNFDLEDFPAPAGGSQPATPFIAVTPDTFRVLGVTLLEGRLLEERDALRPALESVVVDRAWAKRFFPNGSAIGKRFKEGGCTQCPWTTVVGLVGDVKFVGLDQPDQGTVYTPMSGSLTRFLALRTQGDPLDLLPPVRQVIRDLDPGVPFTDVATIGDLVAQDLEQPQALTLLLGSFAMVALALSVVGIYGVMAYYVQQHAKDIGIRMALGGSTAAVLRMVLGQALVIVTSGLLVGLAIALASTKLMSHLFFRVSPNDVPTFSAVSLFLAAAALGACLVPARRAVSLQPAAVLRNE